MFRCVCFRLFVDCIVLLVVGFVLFLFLLVINSLDGSTRFYDNAMILHPCDCEFCWFQPQYPSILVQMVLRRALYRCECCWIFHVPFFLWIDLKAIFSFDLPRSADHCTTFTVPSVHTQGEFGVGKMRPSFSVSAYFQELLLLVLGGFKVTPFVRKIIQFDQHISQRWVVSTTI